MFECVNSFQSQVHVPFMVRSAPYSLPRSVISPDSDKASKKCVDVCWCVRKREKERVCVCTAKQISLSCKPLIHAAPNKTRPQSLWKRLLLVYTSAWPKRACVCVFMCVFMSVPSLMHVTCASPEVLLSERTCMHTWALCVCFCVCVDIFAVFSFFFFFIDGVFLYCVSALVRLCVCTLTDKPPLQASYSFGAEQQQGWHY